MRWEQHKITGSSVRSYEWVPPTVSRLGEFVDYSLKASKRLLFRAKFQRPVVVTVLVCIDYLAGLIRGILSIASVQP